MAKTLKEETLRLDIIVNGDPARKEILKLDRDTKDLAASNKKLRAEMKQLKAEGGENKTRIAEINTEIKRNNETIKANEARIRQIRSEMKITSMTTAELSHRHAELRNAMRNVVPGTAQWTKIRNELKAISTRMAQLRAETNATEGAICRTASNVNKYIGTATAAFAAAAMYASGLRKAVQTHTTLDEAMSNARKTTGMTREEVEELNASFRKIDTRTAQEQLLGMARVGGKLGIAKKDIEGFTRAADVIKISLGKDLGDNVEMTIGQIGKLVNVFHINEEFGIEQGMMKTAAAVNELGKSSTANEANIVDFMRRVGGVGYSAKMSLADIAGLGAALDDLGLTMEVAGTSMSQVITGMFRRTDAFAAAAKMSVADFKKLMAEDMNEALIRVAEGMGADGAGMDRIVAALDSLKLNGTRATGVLTALAQNSDKLRQQQEIARKAFDEGTSCLKEFNIMNTTVEATTEKLQKRIAAEAADLGKALVPAYHESLSAKAALIKTTRILVEWLIQNKGAIVALIATYAAYATAAKIKEKWDGLLSARKKLLVTCSRMSQIALAHETLAMKTGTTSTKLMAAAQLLLAGNLRATALAFKALFASMGPIGLVTIAASALGSTMMVLSNRTSAAAKFKKMLSAHMREAATEAAAEHSELDRLKGKLEGCKAGTKEYNDTKQEIIDKFGKYDSTLKDETLTVQTLRDKYESLSAAIMQSAKTRQYNKFIEAKQSSFDEQFGEISDKLWEKLNDQYYTEKASKYYNQIMSAFFGGQPLDAWLTTGSAKVQRLVRDLEKLRNAQNAAEKEARNRFGTPGTTSGTKTDNDSLPGSFPGTSFSNGDNKGKKQSWSLDNSAEHLAAKQKLRQQYADGEIATEQVYQDRLLALEIVSLQARLAANKESGAARSKLQLLLADKLVEQKKREQQQAEAAENLRIQNIADATERENAEYEQQKKQYAGNAAALEQLAVAHNRKLTQIELQRAMTALKQDENEYKQRRQIIQEQHKDELLEANLTRAERKRVKQRQTNELKALDEEYLRSTLVQLQALNDTGTMAFQDLKGVIQSIDLDTTLLSEEEKNDLLRRINEVENALDTAADRVEELGYSFSTNQGRSILGFSQDDWEKFFENIETSKFGADELKMALTAAAEAANMAMDLYASYDKMMTAKENAELKRYKKNNDTKKKQLQARLDAGVISQSQYEAQVEQMDAEYDKKQEELEIKQAKRQKAQSIVQATIATARAVAEALPNFVLAGIVAAMGAAQVAMIAATPIVGAEKGGFPVERAQDGKRFNATVDPGKRGYVDRPTVLVGENGLEYVIPGEAMQNPTAAPIIDTIEAVRRKGRLRDFDFSQVLPTLYALPGRATGGYVRGASPTLEADRPGVAGIPGLREEDIKEIINLLQALVDKANEPTPAIVSLLGRGGFIETYNKYVKLKKNGQLGE